MLTILFVVVIVAILISVPSWPHSREWGYGPSGGLGLVLLLLVLLMFFRGRLW